MAANFALNPAEAIQNVIDFGSNSGQKLYRSATAKLSDDAFDCSATKLQTFLDQINDRANRYGWINTIMHMHIEGPHHPNPEPEVYLVDNYGQLPLDIVEEHVLTYLFGQGREAQDDNMLYYCLKDSLTPEATAKILTCKSDYMVDDPANPEISKPSGLMLLRVIIRESHVDTNATSMTIRLHLSQLDKYMLSVNSDIEKFNQYVHTQVQMLAARGESSSDLLTNLFKGYNVVQDHEFLKYIRIKESEYEDGTHYTPQQLMGLALNRFKVINQKEMWMAPTPEDEKFMALKAELKKATSDRKRKGKSTEKTKQQSTKSRERERNSSRREFEPRNRRREPPFANEQPEEGKEKDPRNFKGKDWWYCHSTTGGQCPGKWRTHKPAQCKYDAIMAKHHKKPKRGEKDDAPQLTRAYQTIVENDHSDDDSSASSSDGDSN